MRFGIQVNNADQVKDCSIDVTVGDKTVTIGTAEAYGSHTNIYDKSKDGKTVVYTVVVKGIDTQNFNTSIKFTGRAEAIDEAVTVPPTSETSKTVNDVVDAMGNDIYLSNTGSLVKKVTSLSFDAVPASTDTMTSAPTNAFSIYGSASGEISNGVLSLTNASTDGVMYKFGAGDSNDYIISIEVKGETGKYFALTNYGTSLNDMGGISKSDTYGYYVAADGSYQKLDYSVTNSNYSSYEINSRGNGTTLSIKSFVIGKVLEQSDLKDLGSLEDLEVKLTSDNVIAVQAYGNSPTVTVTDGVASLTTTGSNQALAINVTLANGVKLSDYKGISFTFTNNTGEAMTYKRIKIDLKSTDGNIYAPSRDKGQNIFSSELISLEDGDSQTITGDFNDMSSIDESFLTGTVTLSIGPNFDLSGTMNYSISNVKLLA